MTRRIPRLRPTGLPAPKGRDTMTAPAPGAAGNPPEAAADLAARIDLFRSMLRLRWFERRTHELFIEGLVRGTTHLATGQEAVATGFAAAMRPDDYTLCTYRGHDHTLARGVSMAEVMGELMGKAGGLMGGKGG